jgi:transcriptional regulator with XRE-family HTH domain
MNQRQPTSPVDETEQMFARRMRELRTELGLSQAALAQKLSEAGVKIDDLAILRMEKKGMGEGKEPRRIRLGDAAAIANALGSNIHDMLRPERNIDELLGNARELYRMAQARADDAARSAVEAQREIARLEARKARQERHRDLIKQLEATRLESQKWTSILINVQLRVDEIRHRTEFEGYEIDDLRLRLEDLEARKQELEDALRRSQIREAVISAELEENAGGT